MIEAARELRKRKLPCDVLHIDPYWMDIQPNLVCTLRWGEKNWKNHRQMVDQLTERHFKLSLWICPYIPLASELYAEASEQGLLVRDDEGRLIVNKGLMNWFSCDFVYIDFTNPAACEWYKGQLKRLIGEGADVLKVDLGEIAPDEAQYFNGMSGLEGHNYFLLAYQRTVFEAVAEVKGDEAMIWARSGYIGSHKYPVHWAGDVKCDFDNMAGQLRAVLGAGMSGFIFFSHDIGGFTGIKTKPPVLFTRWWQFGMFTSHARVHGADHSQPWKYGRQIMDICLKYTRLRYSLLPHIYSAAIECCQKGEPMLKALVLEYPDDPAVRNNCTDYLFCNDFLVAPVFFEEGVRKVYLPEGTWIDYWTDEAHEGGRWIDCYCKLEKMPLFVRAGSIIVKMPPSLFIDERNPWERLIVEIYPGRGGSQKVYSSPTKCGEVSYEVADGVLAVTTRDIDCPVQLVLRGRGDFRACTLNGAEVDTSKTSEPQTGV